MNITFIIGNGFDINLGLKTRYADMYMGYIETSSNSDVIQHFKDELKEQRYDNWADFEMGMAEYAKSLSSETELIECVRDFKTYLVNHLTKEDLFIKDRFSPNRDYRHIVKIFDDSVEKFYYGLSPNVVNAIQEILGNFSPKYKYLTFNYTRTLEYLQLLKYSIQRQISNNPLHIHGTLDKDVVLGVDNTEQLKGIPYSLSKRGKRAFVKPLFNEQYDKSRINKAKQILESSSIICSYGWSMGDSDKLWVDMIREWVIKSPNHHFIYFKHNIKEYHLHNSDEIMDAEDDEKQEVMKKLGITDEAISEQIHIPVAYTIFDFGAVEEDDLFIAASRPLENGAY